MPNFIKLYDVAAKSVMILHGIVSDCVFDCVTLPWLSPFVCLCLFLYVADYVFCLCVCVSLWLLMSDGLWPTCVLFVCHRLSVSVCLSLTVSDCSCDWPSFSLTVCLWLFFCLSVCLWQPTVCFWLSLTVSSLTDCTCLSVDFCLSLWLSFCFCLSDYDFVCTFSAFVIRWRRSKFLLTTTGSEAQCPWGE